MGSIKQRGDVVHADLGFDDLDRARGGVGPAQSVAEGVTHRDAVDLGGEGAEAVLVGHVLRREGHGEVGAPVVGVFKDDDRALAGGEAGDLDRVLDRLGARVEQRGGLREGARASGRQLFADLDVTLVGVHHETGVGEARDLVGYRVHQGGHGVTDARDRDARTQVQAGGCRRRPPRLLPRPARCRRETPRSAQCSRPPCAAREAPGTWVRAAPVMTLRSVPTCVSSDETMRSPKGCAADPAYRPRRTREKEKTGDVVTRLFPWRRRWDLNPRCP